MKVRKTVALAVGALAVVAVATTSVAIAGAATPDAAADTKAPSAPRNLRSTGATENTVSLSWSASTDDVGVAAYDVYHDGNRYAEAKGDQTSITVPDLAPRTTYRFSVFGRDAAGNVSPPSNIVTVTTRASSDTQAPTAPKNLKATGTTANSVSLTWSAATDNVRVTGYDVFNGDTALAENLTGTSTTIRGLIADTPYQFTVRAKDAAGNVSRDSNKVTARTKPGGGAGGVPSTISTVVGGMTIPWGVAWLPDGSALVGERDSFNVFRITQSGQKTNVGKVPDVRTTDGEGGLLGIAVSPRFNSDRTIFVYHTAKDDNRIVKMTFDGTKLGQPTKILDGIKKSMYHNGGRLQFGPDGYLYATAGDAQTSKLAQDKTSLNGKILRMTTNGDPAPGNPFGTVVYSYGHRNPQGLAWDSAGRLWEAEFGDSKFDELNLIEPGKNYGWPTCEGNCSTPGMTSPKKTWPVDQASPSGIAIVDDVVYMGALRGQRLWRIPLSGASAGTPTAYYVNEYGRLRTVEKIPGANAFWVTTTNCDKNGKKPAGSDKIFRVELK